MKLASILFTACLGVLFAASAHAEPMTYFEGPRKCDLKFTLTPEGKAVVPVTINKSDAFLFIDTGATTVLDLGFARKLGLQPIETEQYITGLTGVAGKHWIAYADLRIGEMQITSYPIGCIDLFDFRTREPEAADPPFIGLIGADLLNILRADIDYGKTRLTIKRPGREQLKPNAAGDSISP